MGQQLFLVLAWTFFVGDSLPVVRNEEVGEGVNFKIRLVEDLVLGPAKGEDYLWIGSNVAVTADKTGNMYILDERENQIVQLNSKGEIVQRIGAEGDGPGEFRRLRRFEILEDGRGIAFENGQNPKITYFDKAMKYVDRKTFSPGMQLITASFSPNGRYLGAKVTVLEQEKARETNRFMILTSGLEPVETILEEVGGAFNESRMEDAGYWVEYLSQRFKVFSKGMNGYVGFSPDGGVYTARAHTYEITKWSPEMKPQLLIMRPYKPVFQTDEEIHAMVDPIRENILSQLPPRFNEIITRAVFQRAVIAAGFPPNRNPVAGLMVMEDGKLVVAHHFSYLTGEAVGDVFSAAGVFLGSFKAPNFGMRLSRMVFRNGFAYTIENRTEDENVLVRYKLEITNSK